MEISIALLTTHAWAASTFFLTDLKISLAFLTLLHRGLSLILLEGLKW